MIRAAAVVALIAVTGCGFGVGYEKPRVTFTRLELTSVGFDSVSARFVYTVENPNWHAVSLATLSYQLGVDGGKPVQGGRENVLNVPPRAAGELGLPITIPFAAVLPGREHVAWTMHVDLGFGTTLGVIPVTADATGTLPVPKPPEVALAAVEIAETTTTTAGLDATIALRNPNEWPLPIGELRYQLTLNGTPIAASAIKPGLLPPNETHKVRAHFSVDLLQVGTAVVGALASRSATINLDGTLALGRTTVPVRAAQNLR